MIVQSVVQVIADSSEEVTPVKTAKPKTTPNKLPIVTKKSQEKTSAKIVTAKPVQQQPKVVISSHVEVVAETTPSIVVSAPLPPKIFTHEEVIVEGDDDDEDEDDDEFYEEEEESPEVNVTPEPKPAPREEKPVTYSSVVEALSSEEDDEPVLQISNNIGEPEYDFLSRQPTEFVEETYRVVNLKPSTTRPKPKKSSQAKKDDTHPTGLVTKLGGTVVNDGLTTVHETSVIGTYISGKYAQVLQSTSHIFQQNVKPKISPSSTLRILKTAAPSLPKTPKHPPVEVHHDDTILPVESLFGNSPSPNLIRSSRRPASPTSSFKNRFKNRPSKEDSEQEYEEIVTPSQVTPSFGSGKKLSSRLRPLGKAKKWVFEGLPCGEQGVLIG